MLKIKPLLADVLNVNKSAIAGMIKDAGQSTAEVTLAEKPTKGCVTLRIVEPWEQPVCGSDLLNMTGLNTMGDSQKPTPVTTVQIWLMSLAMM